MRGCTSSFTPSLPCRLLKPGGALLPDIATLHLAGAGANAGGLGFWSNVYGFDMSPVASALREAASRDAVVAPVQLEELVTPPVQLHSFDLAAMTPSDADFTAEFHIQPDRQQVCDCAVKKLVEHGKIEDRQACFAISFAVGIAIEELTGGQISHSCDHYICWFCRVRAAPPSRAMGWCCGLMSHSVHVSARSTQSR